MESARGHTLELGSLVKQVRAPVALLAMLGAIRILVLPFAAYCVKTTVPLYVPFMVGLVLEPVRSATAIVCRRKVRRGAIVGFASEALDALRLHNSGSPMRAAFVAERAVSVDISGLGAGLLATCVLIVLGASRLGTGLVTGVLLVLFGAAVLGTIIQQRRRPLHRAVVSALMKLCAWMSVASDDQGEISADTSRRSYFRQVARSSDAWSAAEARLERSRLLLRASVGLVVAIGLAAVLVQGDLSRALRELAILKTRQVLNVADFIMLASALPIIVSTARHWDALLSGHNELAALRPMRRTLCSQVRRMEQRPQQLSIRQLEVRYQSELGVRIDELRVELTEPLILVGANGCGKSTLLAAIAGSLEVAQGAVLIDGIASAELDRSQVALVPQEPVLVDELTLLENAQLVVPSVTPMELTAYLDALGLQCDVSDALGSLSRGERRRVAIARALLKYPRLLLLDEPDAWLDAHGRKLLLDVLTAIKSDTAIIIVTHRLEMAQFGRVIAVLGPEQALEAVGTLDQLRNCSPSFRAVVGQ